MSSRGEGHLRLIVHEYVEHYQRNHQGLDNQATIATSGTDADVQRRERAQFLLSRGRMRGRPINRTIRAQEPRDRYNIINEQELLEAGDQLVAYLAQQAQAVPARRRPTRSAPAARPASPLRLVRRGTA